MKHTVEFYSFLYYLPTCQLRNLHVCKTFIAARTNIADTIIRLDIYFYKLSAAAISSK